MTLDGAIKHYKEEAEKYMEYGIETECYQCGKENEQLAEWLTELKEAKRLLKAAVKQMAEVGEVCDCIHSQNCPLDECGKFTFHDEITKLIEG